MKKKQIFLIMAGFILTTSLMAGEQGLLGKRYGSLHYSGADVPDLEALKSFSGDLNLPVNQNFSVGVGIFSGQSSTQFLGSDLDFTSSGYQVSALYHFSPKKKLDPFIEAAFSGISSTAKFESESISDSTSVWGLGVGFEYAMGNKIVLRPQLSYVTSEGESATAISSSIGYWVTGRVIPQFSYLYDLDNKLGAYSLGVNITF